MSFPSLEFFDTKTCRSLRLKLEQWYLVARRQLPWRETTDPYCIWISEIMLQQTTVKAVVPYYERFLSRFPDVNSLAAASESEVLQYWEGLGYYSRGRNLRLAAQVVVQEFGGEFPGSLEQLQKLPGIGRYTAGAIRSFGFNLPAPIVEANTLRLYCRLLGFAGDPRGKAGQVLLWSFAEKLQPPKEAGHLNQALMELGATVCTPVEPACSACPVNRWCVAFQSGTAREIPQKKSRPEVTQVVEGTVAIRNGQLFFVRQRTAGERWAGLWDFPRFPLESISFLDPLGKANQRRVDAELLQQLREQAGLVVQQPVEVMQIRHSVTRYRIRLICMIAEYERERPQQEMPCEAECRWVTLKELASLPMPVTGRQFAERLLEMENRRK